MNAPVTFTPLPPLAVRLLDRARDEPVGTWAYTRIVALAEAATYRVQARVLRRWLAAAWRSAFPTSLEALANAEDRLRVIEEDWRDALSFAAEHRRG